MPNIKSLARTSKANSQPGPGQALPPQHRQKLVPGRVQVIDRGSWAVGLLVNRVGFAAVLAAEFGSERLPAR